ncbi:MAG: MerR family transcriptional regulator [Hyphomicrobiales bacterium]|uniref:MerR family transcriptional regulator n=1 Tax=Nisaea sp. TaxID=2024842 RepID=UPI00329397C2
MRIAEAATLCGLSPDTIRYYEKSDMLPPIARGADGYRQYTQENVNWLTILYWLRQTGMSMKVMQRYAVLVHAGDQTVAERIEILEKHGIKLKERREELDRCEELLARKLNAYSTIKSQTNS